MLCCISASAAERASSDVLGSSSTRRSPTVTWSLAKARASIAAKFSAAALWASASFVSAFASAPNRRCASSSTLFEMTTDSETAIASTTAMRIAVELAAMRVEIERRPAARSARPPPTHRGR